MDSDREEPDEPKRIISTKRKEYKIRWMQKNRAKDGAKNKRNEQDRKLRK